MIYSNYDLIGILSLLIAGGFTIFYFIIERVINYKIQYSIKLDKDKKLEDYKSDEIKRQKAVLISSFFAEWMKADGDIEKLNQLLFEAYLWLPKEIALKLSQRVLHREEAPSMEEIICDTRVWILNEDQRIDPGSIVHFKYPEIPIKKTEQVFNKAGQN